MQPSGNQYILVVKGKPEGPFTIEQLRERRLRPGDFVKTPEMIDYKEAHEVAELCELFHFKRRVAEPQYFAGLDLRLLASALDWLFIAGFYILLGFTAIIVIKDSEARLTFVLSLIPFTILTKFVYHVIMECSQKQATYGKQILKIKVSDLEGKRASVPQAFVRNFCKLFSSVFFIGYLVSFFNRRQQCLHDMMAGTLVIKERLI